MAPLTQPQVNSLVGILNHGIEFVKSFGPDGGAASGSTATEVPEAQWMAEYRRTWNFLKSLDEAGGDVTAPELSRIARENGYDPRGLGGFYTGDNPSLKSEGDRRLITDVGRRFIEQWRSQFEK